MKICINKLKFTLFALLLAVQPLVYDRELYAAEQIPAEDIEQFVDIFNRIKEQYVDEIDDQELFKSAIKGMVSGLDPHSSYLSSEDFDELFYLNYFFLK